MNLPQKLSLAVGTLIAGGLIIGQATKNNANNSIPSASSVQQSTTSEAPNNQDTSSEIPPTNQQEEKASDSQGSNCNPNYSPCIPNGSDLDCPDVGMQVRVIGTDEYRLDRDGDGIGCDSY